jgi:hypothetical protein
MTSKKKLPIVHVATYVSSRMRGKMDTGGRTDIQTHEQLKNFMSRTKRRNIFDSMYLIHLFCDFLAVLYSLS